MDRQALKNHAGAVKRHPDFERASRRFAENMLQAFEVHQPLNRLLRGENQLAFLAFVLSLHHDRNPSDPSSGASYSRVIELFGLLNIASPTLVKALLGVARLRGHLQVQSVPGTRTKRLMPTDELLQTLCVWLSANLGAVELIHPFPLPAEELGSQPAMLYQIFHYGVSAYVHNQFVLSEEFPPVRAFMARNHGYLVLMALVASSRHSGDSVSASAPSLELARRLSVSRGTVRNMLSQAQTAGWLTAMSRGSNQFTLSSAFAAMCEDWMAMELAWMSGVAGMAWQTLASRRD